MNCAEEGIAADAVLLQSSTEKNPIAAPEEEKEGTKVQLYQARTPNEAGVGPLMSLYTSFLHRNLRMKGHRSVGVSRYLH